jgi:hypothetical protein
MAVSEALNVQKEDLRLRREVPSSHQGSASLRRVIGILAAGWKSIFLQCDN